MTTSGHKIKALLKQRGMTITDLGERANIDRSAMTNIANDEIPLGEIRAKRIAKALNVPVAKVWQPREEDVASRRDLHRRLREVEDDRDWLFEVVRELLAHLDRSSIGAPDVPAAPRSGRVAPSSTDATS